MNRLTAQAAECVKTGPPGRFVKNWAYLLSASIVSQLLGMIATIRIARVISPAGFGHFSLVQTTAGIGLVVVGLGMRNTIIRDSARYSERAGVLFAAGLWIRIFFGIFIGAGIVLYAALSPKILPTSLSGYTVLLLFGLIVWDTTESISFGSQRMEYSSGISALGSILWALWIWSLPRSTLTVASVSFSFAMLQILKAGAFTSQLKRIAPTAGPWDLSSARGEFRRLIVDSFPFYWLALLTMFQIQIPILLLAERSDPTQVGLYNVGFRLLNPLQLLMATGLSALYPYLSKAKVHDPARYMKTIELAIKITIFVGSGLAMVISFIRVEVVKILFGSPYLKSADAMVFQCWYTVLYAMLCLLGTSLAASDKQRWLANLSTANTIVVLPLIWIGAAHGATGLAAGLAGSAVINLVYVWIVFQKSLPGRLDPRLAVQSFGILACAGVGSRIIPITCPVIIRVAMAGIILIGIGIVVLKGWQKVEKTT